MAAFEWDAPDMCSQADAGIRKELRNENHFLKGVPLKHFKNSIITRHELKNCQVLSESLLNILPVQQDFKPIKCTLLAN